MKPRFTGSSKAPSAETRVYSITFRIPLLLPDPAGQAPARAVTVIRGLDSGRPANWAAWERPVLYPRGICTDGSLAVGQREVAIEVTHVHSSDRGQLMDDHLRPGPRHGLRDLIRIKRVRDRRHSAQIAEHRLL